MEGIFSLERMMPSASNRTPVSFSANCKISPSASGPPSVALVRIYCTESGSLMRARSRRMRRLVSMPVAPLYMCASSRTIYFSFAPENTLSSLGRSIMYSSME